MVQHANHYTTDNSWQLIRVLNLQHREYRFGYHLDFRDLKQVIDTVELRDLKQVLGTVELRDLKQVLGTVELRDLKQVLDTVELRDLKQVLDTVEQCTQCSVMSFYMCTVEP